MGTLITRQVEFGDFHFMSEDGKLKKKKRSSFCSISVVMLVKRCMYFKSWQFGAFPTWVNWPIQHYYFNLTNADFTSDLP